MLRSRRPRARHGAQLCAVVSAFLLLISVSLLYTRLSLFSSQSPNHLRAKRFPNEDDAVLFPDSLLVSDDEDGGASGSAGRSSSNEDTIDEHDTVEDDRNDSILNEDEDNQEVEQEQEADTDRNKVLFSGFYFDHINGVIRRAYNKRSIDDWDYDYIGFSMGSGMDNWSDKSKAAFGSDDIPVDEAIRRKMTEVSGIEDALLLKTGKRVSPLRDGWGDWFDKKGDFLRRDRMFKSNLEMLNPLNNPMLQDPDGVGVTGLTRGDRLVQKWLLNEFKRVPFMGKKPSSVLEKSHEVESGENGVGSKLEKIGNHKSVNADNNEVKSNKLKGAERKTLDDDDVKNQMAKNRNEDPKRGEFLLEKDMNNREKSFNAGGNTLDENGKKSEMKHSSASVIEEEEPKNADSKAHERKDQFPDHIYADGTRWGYYPGLGPSLSYSNFMDSFFRKEKCLMRVFMVWNSPPWMYSVRHQRALESLLAQHRDACVIVLSETIELDFFRDSFVKDGFKVAVAMPNLDELLKDTPTHVFASVWFDWRKTKFYATHYSELVRLAALYKYGGIYLDSDVIVLRSLSLLKNTVGMEDQATGGSLNGAIMAFDKHSPFLRECLNEYYLTYDDTCLRCNGADLLTRVAERFLSGKNRRINQQELKVQPPSVFFPISSQHITSYFTSPASETERAEQDGLFKKILNESLTFHFWNSVTSSLIPEPESLVTRFIDHSCIRCSDVL